MFERIIYSILCCIFLYYSFYKFIKTKNNLYLGILAFQLIATVIEILAVATSETMDWFVQAYIFAFGIFIPFMDFWFDYVHFDYREFLNIKTADHYYKHGDYLKALDYYKKAITKNPKNAETFAKIGKTYNAINDRRTAFDFFARAVELNRNDYKSYFEIGAIFNDIGKKSDAKIMLDNALRIKPDFIEASELLAVVLCALNKYDDAISVYKDAIKYDPQNYQLYYSMGVVRSEVRDFNEAKECYEQAIKLNPELYDAYFSLGQIYLLRGELLEAENMFKKALYDKDLIAKSYYQLAKVYMLNGEEIKAVTYIEYAIEKDSTYRYKADSEPMFNKIKDYLKGLHMVSQVQMQLEKDLDKKLIKEEDTSFSNDAQFNFMDKYSER